MKTFFQFITERAKVRNYKKEYAEFQGTPKQLKYQSNCHKARRTMGLGNNGENPGVEVDHKRPLSKGGSNKKSNLRVVSRRTNRKKGNKLKS